MEFLLSRNWGWIALRGLAAVVFGLLTLFDPSISLTALVLLWGAYAFVDGIFAIVSAVRDRRQEPHWVSLLVTGIAAGARIILGFGPRASGLIAAVSGAVIFSAFHYIGPYGDRLELQSFVFRALSGLAFSGLYLLRGFGITAWTHALYDAFLLLA